MEKILELDRIVYAFTKDEDREVRILLIKELINGVPVWKTVEKAWEYYLWYTISQRAGLAEAEELVILEDNVEKNLKIEDYIKIYRNELNNNLIPVEDIFNKFKIKAIAWKSKKLDEYDENYIAKRITDDYRLDKVKEDNSKVYYEKEVLSVEHLINIPSNDLRDDRWEVKLIFQEV